MDTCYHTPASPRGVAWTFSFLGCGLRVVAVIWGGAKGSLQKDELRTVTILVPTGYWEAFSLVL